MRWSLLVLSVGFCGCAPSLADLEAQGRSSTALSGVMVMRHGDGTRERVTFGFADLAKSREVVAADRFRVGSITKLFTGALVGKLIDAGELSLDDTVASFGLSVDRGDTITVRQLLNHTAGLVEYNSDPGFDWSRAWSPREVVDWVTTKREPVFEPGTRFGYSGAHFQVLALIAGAEGRPSYTPALRQRVLEPLALNDTFLEGGEPVTGGRVDGSRRVDGKLLDREFADDWESADGSLATSADDLVTFMERVFLTRDVLSEAYLSEAVKPTVLPDGKKAEFLGERYGLALELEDDPAGDIYSHGGLDFGFAAYVGVQPATGRAVAVVLSGSDLDPRVFARQEWAHLTRDPH